MNRLYRLIREGGTMLKYIFYILLAIAVLALIAGGIHLYRVSARNKAEMAQFAGPKIGYHNTLGKTLVIYYSLSGHTKDIADRIALLTDADVYEIKPKEPLKPGILFSLDARRQLKSGNYPKIEENLPDASAYDMIFVGAPIWWYTAATPVLEFLKTYDFKGRKVVPFSTQGSNFGSYFDDFAAKAKNAKILPGASFNNLSKKYDDAVDNKITDWLNKL